MKTPSARKFNSTARCVQKSKMLTVTTWLSRILPLISSPVCFLQIPAINPTVCPYTAKIKGEIRTARRVGSGSVLSLGTAIAAMKQ